MGVCRGGTDLPSGTRLPPATWVDGRALRRTDTHGPSLGGHPGHTPPPPLPAKQKRETETQVVPTEMVKDVHTPNPLESTKG